MSILKQQALFIVFALLSVVAFFLYQEDVARFFRLKDIYFYPRLYKYLFAVLVNYALISLFYLLLRKTWITLFISQCLFFSFHFINIKKEQYLSASFVPSDVLLFKETLIAAPWSLKISVFAAVVAFLAMTVFLYRKENKEALKSLIPNGLITVSILGFFVSANFTNNFSEFCQNKKQGLCAYTTALPNTSGDWVGDHLTIKNTGFMTFFVSKSLDSVNTKIFKTEDIAQAEIEKILAVPQHTAETSSDIASEVPADQKEYSSTQLTTPAVTSPAPDALRPNIVFVMSEAHWDARKLDASIPKNITPTIDRYQVAELLSPTFGGGTANVEFEVLTSLNVMLNHNELAYVSKLKRPTYSLATYMNDLGYDTTAMHNNGKYFYNRSSVYQNLGFKRFTSIENMVSDADRKKYTNKGGWANDDLIYQSIYKQLDQSVHQPQFIYAITVENHFNYNDDRFGKDNFKITKSGITDINKRQLNTYLTGLQRADQQFEKLISHAQTLERPTMIIFFGDHLPNLGSIFDQYQFYENAEQKAQKKHEKFFRTPISVWSNFEIERQSFKADRIPAHFLAVRSLHAAQLPSSPYYDFMTKMSQCYRKIHQTGTETHPNCGLDPAQLLKQYENLNMDIINGKNFSYDLLKPQDET